MSANKRKIPKPEFRYNKRRKHYSYIYKFNGDYRQNLLLSTKPVEKINKNGKIRVIKNVKLYKHPNYKSDKSVYVMPRRYIDHKSNFDRSLPWAFHTFDKRQIKRLKKGKKK